MKLYAGIDPGQTGGLGIIALFRHSSRSRRGYRRDPRQLDSTL